MNEYWLGVARELLEQQRDGIHYRTEGEPSPATWIGRAAAVLEEVLRTSEAETAHDRAAR